MSDRPKMTKEEALQLLLRDYFKTDEGKDLLNFYISEQVGKEDFWRNLASNEGFVKTIVGNIPDDKLMKIIQNYEIPCKIEKIFTIKEGYFGIDKFLGKSKAARNKLINSNVLSVSGDDFEIYPHATEVGGEESYKFSLGVTSDIDLSLLTDGIDENQLLNKGNDLERFEILYERFQNEVKAIISTSTNAGDAPLKSAPNTLQNLKEELDQYLENGPLAPVRFEGNMRLPRETILRPRQKIRNSFVIEEKTSTKLVPKQIDFLTIESLNSNMLFCPHWMGNLYENPEIGEKMRDFVKKTTEQGIEYIGVASTMGDLKYLKMLSEGGRLEKTGLFSEYAATGGLKDFKYLLGNNDPDFGVLTTSINEKIQSLKIIRDGKKSKKNQENVSDRQIYEEIENVIIDQLYGGRNIKSDIIDPKVDELVREGKVNEAINFAKGVYKKEAQVRKLVLDTLLGQIDVVEELNYNWKHTLVTDITQTFTNAFYCAGVHKEEFTADVDIQRDRNHLVIKPEFIYKDEKLETQAFGERDKGGYSIFVKVPGRLYGDEYNPMNIGLQVERDKVICCTNMYTVVGAPAIPDSLYKFLLPLVATKNLFPRHN